MASNDGRKSSDVKDEPECCGFLKKKGRHSPRWSSVFAKVEPCVLKYGPSEQVLF